MIFFDMDGTLARFYDEPNYLEKMYEPNYFFSLKPYKLVELVRKLVKDGKQVAILSACVDSAYCEQEKRAWLRMYLPEIPEKNIILCKTSENKLTVAREWLEQNQIKGKAILVDDYSKNLYDWVVGGMNFIPIKFINGINNKQGNEYRYTFKTNKQLENLINKIVEGV